MGPFRKEFIAVVAGVLIVAGTSLGLVSVQKEVTALQNEPTPMPVIKTVVITPTSIPTATPEAKLKPVVRIGTPASAVNVTKGAAK